MSSQRPAEVFPEGTCLLGRYKVLSMIGQGGCGVVYKATQTSTEQEVAIKVLKIQGMTPAMREEQQKRFWREMKLIGKLGNPHTVRLIDSGIERDHPIMVLEYVDGTTLRDKLRRGGLYPSLAKRIIGQALEAVAEAHALGVVHRDLKPDNIMLVGQGRWASCKVLDFGLSGVMSSFQDSAHQNITRFGQILGTPGYMAPELLMAFATPRVESDIYAIGLILLECLTGKPAFYHEDPRELSRMQIDEPIEIPPSLYAMGFGAIIERACQKDPARRYRSALLMLADLEDCAAASDVIAIPPDLLDAPDPDASAPQAGLDARDTDADSANHIHKLLGAEGDDSATIATDRPEALRGVNLDDLPDDSETIATTRPDDLKGVALLSGVHDAFKAHALPQSRLPQARLSPAATVTPKPQPQAASAASMTPRHAPPQAAPAALSPAPAASPLHHLARAVAKAPLPVILSAVLGVCILVLILLALRS
jgi:serine/threonine protein kinase